MIKIIKKIVPLEIAYYFHSAKSDIRYTFRDYSSWQSDTVVLLKNAFIGSIVLQSVSLSIKNGIAPFECMIK